MKNSDEAIDRVLEGLRQATPPEGMTQRIHQSLRATPHTQQPSTTSLTLRSLLSPPALSVAAVTLVIILFSIYWNSARIPRNQPIRAQQQQPKSISAPSALSTTAAASQPQSGQHSTRPKAPPTQRLRPNRIQVVSYPAPEAPLTDQERLLVRLAHRVDPQTLEAYSPAQNEAHLTQEKAQFQQFFDPPTAVGNE